MTGTVKATLARHPCAHQTVSPLLLEIDPGARHRIYVGELARAAVQAKVAKARVATRLCTDIRVRSCSSNHRAPYQVAGSFSRETHARHLRGGRPRQLHPFVSRSGLRIAFYHCKSRTVHISDQAAIPSAWSAASVPPQARVTGRGRMGSPGRITRCPASGCVTSVTSLR